MDQPDDMIDKVIILSVNFCLFKITYQVTNFLGQIKGTKVKNILTKKKII